MGLGIARFDFDAPSGFFRFAERCEEAGVDPTGAVVLGEASHLLERMRAHVRAGISKFVLVPLARGDDALADQLEGALAEVIPAAEDSSFVR